MNTLLNDLRSAFRLIAKNPAFSFVVITTLALGIGLNTAVFSALDALLLRPLPGVQSAGQLVQLYRRWPGMDFGSNSIPHFQDVQSRSKDAFTDVAAHGCMMCIAEFPAFVTLMARPRVAAWYQRVAAIRIRNRKPAA